MKTPRLPKGWKWNLDRTGEVVAVTVRGRGWLLVYVVLLASPRTFAVKLHALRIAALWEAYVRRPLEELDLPARVWARFAAATSRVDAWFVGRSARATDARFAFAHSVNGEYDHRGQRI